jgi:hypothetical protein
MSAKVPGFSDYSTDPFELAVSTTPAFFGSLTGNWSPSSGSTAILLVQMPADGESVALCTSTFSGAVAEFPDSPLHKARQDSTTNVAYSMATLPVRYTDIAGTNIGLVASSSFNAVCRFLPITEPGD